MVRFSRVWRAVVRMGHPQVIRFRQRMRDDGGNTLKSQDHREGLRTLPLRRFLKKNLPFQGVGAGLMKISYLGNAGWRSNRASTACIAVFPSTRPFWYTLRLSSTTGCIPFQVIFLAHASIVSASISFVPFHCNSKRPQHRSIGLSLLWE